MEKVLIFGHKNPDTDSICSSIAMENLEKKFRNEIVEAVALGNVNKETQYVLNYLNIEKPRVIEEIDENQEVILVDHNEFNQSVKGIEKSKILKVIDHHRINDFKTADPLFYYAQPVGCTATLVYEIYNMNNIEIEEKIAVLMLSAIISDTLLFKSPTCTPKDIEVAKKLAEIANIDINTYGLEMLKAGTDLGDFSEEELITLDMKKTVTNGLNLAVAQINTVSIEDVLKREDKLKNAINKKIEEENFDLFVFAITDILESNSEIIAFGKRTDIVEKTNKLENNRAFLPGVVSRKKQILPMLEANI